MRTLEEMKQDASHINSNLKTLETIANLDHNFGPIDIHTYNLLSEATKDRIEKFKQALCEAFESIGTYARELAAGVKTCRISYNYAVEQLVTAHQVNKALCELHDCLNAQINKFNKCLDKAEKHP